MKLQLDAIRAAVGLFEGQPGGACDFSFGKATGVGGTFLSVVSNNLIIDEGTIIKNLRRMQEKHGITGNGEFEGMNFTVEMETGQERRMCISGRYSSFTVNTGSRSLLLLWCLPRNLVASSV